MLGICFSSTHSASEELFEGWCSTCPWFEKDYIWAMILLAFLVLSGSLFVLLCGSFRLSITTSGYSYFDILGSFSNISGREVLNEVFQILSLAHPIPDFEDGPSSVYQGTAAVCYASLRSSLFAGASQKTRNVSFYFSSSSIIIVNK